MSEAEPDLDALWEIAKEVAGEDPTYETGFGDIVCAYCGGDNYSSKGFKHDEDCIVTKARKLIAERGTASIKIDRLDGSCPVQATGTIGGHSAFYFRGRHEQWQFVAGPKELSRDDLVKVQLKFIKDPDVFVLEGDDEERTYQDYDHVRNVLQDYAKQYVAWMDERKNAT